MAQYIGTSKGIRSEVPSFDYGRQLVPTVLTTVEPKPFTLFYLEVCNPTGGDVNLSVSDIAGLALFPTQTLRSGAAPTTYRSDYGTPMNGLAWIASAPGLVGWFCGAYT